MTRKIFILVFILLPSLIYAQLSVTGKVCDTNGNPISRASVSVLSQDKLDILTFGTTNTEGLFSLKLREHSVYILKVSSLGYETVEKRFNTRDTLRLDVILHEKQQELKEVEIKAYPKSYIAKKDTITYDLAKVKDGTEQNIGEVINKLPGLSVDNEGKVSYQGNKIDKLMVDGQDFFGKMQQMATKNLRPDMIAEAELLTNYRESLLDIGSSKTVLNLKTNDKYKGVPTGDALLQPGLVNKYLGHSNLFRFSKAGNMGLIADVNNIGDSPMSLMDFIDLRGGISSLMSPGAQSQVIRLDPTQYPRFLVADQNIKSKANRFIGVNITSRISDRLDLKLYSLYNSVRQTGETRSWKEYAGEQPLRFSEFTDEKGRLDYNTTHLDLKYLMSSVSQLHFTSTYSAGRDNYDKSVRFIRNASAKQFLTGIHNRNYTFGNRLEYQHKLSPTGSWISVLSYNIISNTQGLGIDSDSTISYWNTSSLFQKYNSLSKDLNFNTNFTFSTPKVKYLLGAGLQDTRARLESDVPDIRNALGLNRAFYLINANADFELSSKTRLSWRNKLSGTAHEYNAESRNMLFYEPGISLSYFTGPAFRVTLSANRKNQLPSIENLIEHPLVTDYRTLIYNKNLLPFKSTVSHIYSLGFTSFGIKKEQFISANINYTNNFNSVFRTNSLVNETAITRYVYAPRENTLQLHASYDKKIYFIPVYLKGNVFFTYTTGTGFAGETETAFTRTLTNSRLSAGTRFKRRILQVHGELDLQKSRFTQEVNKLNSGMGRYISSLRFSGVKGEMVYALKLSQYLQTTRIGNNRIHMLSPEIRWVPGKSKIEYGIRGHNVLNLTGNKIYTAVYNNISSTESEISILDGYLLASVKLKF